LTERDGLVIPAQLDTPHAVSYVLTQRRGQLKMKHVQKGLWFSLCVFMLISVKIFPVYNTV